MKSTTALLISLMLATPLLADIEFDGDDYATGTTIGDTSGFTFGGWIKAGTQTKAPAVVIYNGNDSANGYGMMVHDGSGGVGQTLTVVAGGVNFNVTTGAPALTAGTWYHVAFKVATGSGSTATLYLNGAAVGTGTITFNNPSGGNFMVGGNTTANGFVGTITDVFYHNGALSDGAIASVYNSRLKYSWIAMHGTTLNYWPMDEVAEGAAGDGLTFLDRNTSAGGAGNLTISDGANNVGATGRASQILSYP